MPSMFRVLLFFKFILLVYILILSAGCIPVENDSLLDVSLEEDAVVNYPDPFDDLACPTEGEQGDSEEDLTQTPAGSDEDQGQPAADNESGEELLLKVIADGNYLLALVTKETTLKRDYKPTDLLQIPQYMNPSYSMQLRAEALEQLKALWQVADTEGVILHIRSAYRSYDIQKGLFESYADRYGEDEANLFSARPGQSEHQLGTTVDFGGTAVDFKAAFADTPQGLWLAENAHQFGFVMSYPEGMEHLTGYIFEPWHFRYIGVEDATTWKASGKSLKEYLESMPQAFD